MRTTSGSPLRRVEQQRQRQPRLGAHRMARLERRNFVLGPTVKAVGRRLDVLCTRAVGSSSIIPSSIAKPISVRNMRSQWFAAPGVSALAASIATMSLRRSVATRLSPCSAAEAFQDVAVGRTRDRLISVGAIPCCNRRPRGR